MKLVVLVAALVCAALAAPSSSKLSPRKAAVHTPAANPTTAPHTTQHSETHSAVHVHHSPLATLPRVMGKRVQGGLVMTASPAVLKGAEDSVTITWSGHQFPTSSDWIGVWCPASLSPYDSSPVKFNMITVSPTWQQGSGNFTLIMSNLRADCVFYLMTGGAQYPFIVGESNSFTFEDFNTPTGIHMALPGSDPSLRSHSDESVSVRITWTSLNAKQPTLRIGNTSGAYLTSLPATTSSYTQKDLCGSPAADRAWLAPGSIHTVVVSGLRPLTKYFYIVGDAAGAPTSFSQEITFVAPPLTGDRSQTYNIVAFGDMGNAGKDGSQQHSWDYDNHGEINAVNTTLRIAGELQNDLSLVIHIGDISYAVGYEAEWDQFMNQIQPVAASVPWMTGIGNHEMGTPSTYMPGTDSGGECGVPYASRFLMPAPANTGNPNTHWYGFTHGLVHVIVMSTEHDFTTSSPQYAFIKEELKRVNRKVTPFLIFTGHRPMYVDSTYSGPQTSDQTVAQQLRDNLEPLLLQYKVDLAMWGHHHTYQRTCPVYNQTCTDDGTTHVVIGMAGYSLTHNFPDVLPPYFVVAKDDNWGYTRIQVNSTHLTMQFVIDTDGSIEDEFTLQARNF